MKAGRPIDRQTDQCDGGFVGVALDPEGRKERVREIEGILSVLVGESSSLHRPVKRRRRRMAIYFKKLIESLSIPLLMILVANNLMPMNWRIGQ